MNLESIEYCIVDLFKPLNQVVHQSSVRLLTVASHQQTNVCRWFNV